tara:strand:+ start:2695 stop:2832 length:138 start_codon:yes stop_codon:yes gene_type:complete
VQGLGTLIDEGDRHGRLSKAHGDTAAHGAGADDGGASEWTRFHAL